MGENYWRNYRLIFFAEPRFYRCCLLVLLYNSKAKIKAEAPFG